MCISFKVMTLLPNQAPNISMKLKAIKFVYILKLSHCIVITFENGNKRD